MKKTLALLLVSAVAFGSGYEKSIFWGAKYGGLAGSGAAGVTGSDSIFYNPAGLVNSSETGDIVFNLSNSSSQFKGPVVPSTNVVMAPASSPGTPTVAPFTYANKQESSTKESAMIPAITYAMKLNDAWSFGLGYYVVGGARANYEDVDFAPRNYKAKVGSEITITEFSVGAGYKVSDSFRLGLGVRYTMLTAGFSSVAFIPATAPFTGAQGAVANVDIKDINSANLDSIRFGAQWDVSETTKLGLVVRTDTNVSKTAKASGTANICTTSCQQNTTLVIPESDVKVKTMLPMQVNLGIEQKLSDSWTLFGELGQTQYSKIQKVDLDGNLTVAGNTVAISDIEQKWKDQMTAKLAGQYAGFSWPVRFGYIYTSEVSSKDYARASFTPPGVAATYTLGTGQTFAFGNNSVLDFNLAIDVTSVKGDTSGIGPQPLYTPKGTHEVSATGIHTGFAYRF